MKPPQTTSLPMSKDTLAAFKNRHARIELLSPNDQWYFSHMKM